MTVYGVDLIEKYNFVNYTSVEKVLPQADIVVCAMNLNPASSGYFDYKKLKTAKPGVIFINIARGEMSPSADLLKLIREGHLGGLAMDVYNQEALLAVSLRHQKTPEDPEVQAVLELVKYPNVIFTPHNAFNTREAVIRKSQQSMQQVEAFLKTGHFLWPLPVDEIKVK